MGQGLQAVGARRDRQAEGAVGTGPGGGDDLAVAAGLEEEVGPGLARPPGADPAGEQAYRAVGQPGRQQQIAQVVRAPAFLVALAPDHRGIAPLAPVAVGLSDIKAQGLAWPQHPPDGPGEIQAPFVVDAGFAPACFHLGLLEGLRARYARGVAPHIVSGRSGLSGVGGVGGFQVDFADFLGLPMDGLSRGLPDDGIVGDFHGHVQGVFGPVVSHSESAAQIGPSVQWFTQIGPFIQGVVALRVEPVAHQIRGPVG